MGWDTKIRSKLKAIPETRPEALAQDKYGMAVRFNWETAGHVQKSFLKITYLCKSWTQSRSELSGERRFPHNPWLKRQWSFLWHTLLHFYNISTNADMHFKLIKLVESKTDIKKRQRKATTKKQTIILQPFFSKRFSKNIILILYRLINFSLIISTDSHCWKTSYLFPPILHVSQKKMFFLLHWIRRNTVCTDSMRLTLLCSWHFAGFM